MQRFLIPSHGFSPRKLTTLAKDAPEGPISLLGDPEIDMWQLEEEAGQVAPLAMTSSPCIHVPINHINDKGIYKFAESSRTHQPPFATVSCLSFHSAHFRLLPHHDTYSPRLASCFTTITSIFLGRIHDGGISTMHPLPIFNLSRRHH